MKDKSTIKFKSNSNQIILRLNTKRNLVIRWCCTNYYEYGIRIKLHNETQKTQYT